MEIKDFGELTQPAEETLAFGFLRTLSRDEQARDVQSMAASADLCAEVPEDLRASFERLRRIFAYGLFFYETFTAVEDLAWLMMEQAFRERFVTFYEGSIPLISKVGAEAILSVHNLEEVYDAFHKGGQYVGSGWTVKLRSTDGRLRGRASFNGGFAQLLRGCFKSFRS